MDAPTGPREQATTRLLELEPGAGLEETLARCRDVVEDVEFPTVRRWREGGGKVLGHFQVYFPEELAHAAGFLPVKVRGAQVERRMADSRFGSYLCSILRSSLELALSGRLELDLFVTHPICDAARNLAGVWARNLPVPARILYLPQNANSPAAAAYLRGEYGRVLRDIEEIAGRQVRAEDLEWSIAVFNENRRLLRELYALKREEPWKLLVDEAYVLVAIGGLIPREEHNSLLSAVLPQLRRRDVRRQDRIRVVFEGGFCEQPPLDLLRAIGQFCYVVDDDFQLIHSWLLDDVDIQKPPLQALAEAFLHRSVQTSSKYDERKQDKGQYLLRQVRNRGAEGVVFAAPSFCDPALLERPMLQEILAKHKIPYTAFKFAENTGQMAPIREQAGTFADSIKLWSAA